MRTSRALGALWLGLILVAMVALPAAAQVSSPTEIEITDVVTTRYPRMTAVVEVRNVPLVDESLLTVIENGDPVQAIEITRVSDSSVAVGIVLTIDVSGSMAGEPIEAAKDAARSFVQQKRDQDFIAIVAFSDAVEIRSGFTRSESTLLGRIDELQVGGATALYDAVVTSASLYSGDAQRLQRNMIILTDGSDTDSVATLEEAAAAVEDGAIRTFAVALESPELNLEPLRALVTTPDDLLTTTDPAELSLLYNQIQSELDNTLIVKWDAQQTAAGDLEVAVSYAGLSAATTVEVPGFVPAGFVPGTTSPVSYPEAVAYTIGSDAPFELDMLKLFGTIAVIVAVLALVLIVVRPRSAEARSSFGARLTAYGRGRSDAAEEKKGIMTRLPFLRVFSERAEQAAESRGLLAGINSALEQANIALSAGEALAAALGVSIITAMLVGLMTQSVIWAALAFAGAILLVFALINYFGSREKRKFEKQLPDTLTLISTSLRAGYSLLQATEAVAAEAPSPTSREFGRAISEARLGRPVVDSLRGIAERMKSGDFVWAVMAIEIQREVGGNLAEVLMIVADTMRQRNRLKGEIRALTAEGRISAFVLGGMPFGLFFFLFATNREYLEPLFETTAGLVMIGGGLALLGIGMYWLYKIVNIEV